MAAQALLKNRPGLPESQAQYAWRMYYRAGVSLDGIAEGLGCSRGTVDRAIQRVSAANLQAEFAGDREGAAERYRLRAGC